METRKIANFLDGGGHSLREEQPKKGEEEKDPPGEKQDALAGRKKK